MDAINPVAVQSYRQRRLRQTLDLRVKTLDDAAGFVNEVGLCLFQPNQGVELPSLWGAVAGSSGPAPRWGQHDSLYNRVWGWKDHFLDEVRFYYGKALGNYRLFISRSLLPHMWALSEMNYGGEPDDYLEMYQDGKLSLDAKRVYEVLCENGASSTTVLRRRTGMVGDGRAWARFERALTELQRGLLIGVVGIADDNAWKYTFKYATLDSAYPEEVAAAREIPSRVAMGRVLEHYVWLMGATRVRAVARLFGWDQTRCLRVARGLLEEGRLAGKAEDGDSVLLTPELVEVLASSA